MTTPSEPLQGGELSAQELKARYEKFERRTVRRIRSALRKRGGSQRVVSGLVALAYEANMQGRIQGKRTESDPGGRHFYSLMGASFAALIRALDRP